MPCGRTIEQANGVIACFHCTAYCEDGTWSECSDGEISYQPDPGYGDYSGRFDVAALTPSGATASPCVNNPCDPRCLFFDEDPTDITGGGGPTPGLPSFPAAPGIPACEHDMCTTGAPLFDRCHSCVEKVCAATPSCCSTAWTASCADSVYSLCGNTRPPLSLCEMGLYSDLTLTLANRSTSDAVIGSYGDVNLATEANPSGVYSKGNISFSSLNQSISVPYGIVADGWVDAQDANYTVTGFIEAGGNVSIRSWDVTGSVSSGGALSGQNSTTIGGNAKANSTISNVQSVAGSTCSGAGCYTHRPVVLPPKTGGTAIPVLSVDCSGVTNFSANGTTTIVGGPAAYGDVNVINGGTVRLQGEGRYYFKSFNVSGNVQLQRTATNTGAGWDIRICNGVGFGNGVLFRGMNTGGVTPPLALDPVNAVLMDPGLVTFYANTSSSISMGTDVYFTGIFMAPKASVTKANVNGPPPKAQVLAGTRAAPVNGAIWAHQLNLGTDAMTKQIPVSVCEAMNIPGTTDAGAICPIANVTPPIPTPINEPCQSGLDCQINRHCSEPKTAASCAHSKCMPGAALSASCDPCVARICEQDASCCGSNWSPSCVAKVASVCDATCGALDCYVPDACQASAAPIASTCDSCVANICSSDPSCCTTAWTQSCADKVFTQCGSGIPIAPTLGVSICDYASYASGAASIMGANVGLLARVKGGRVGGSGLGSMNLSFSDIAGNVYNAGSFYTYYTNITGTLYYGSGTNSIGSNTTYAALVSAAPAQPARPVRSFTCGGSAVSSGTTLAPGSYGSVSIPNGQTLSLSAGTYYFSSLAIGAGSANAGSYGNLALPSSGRVTINVCGTVTFNNYARISGLTVASAANLDVFATGNIRMMPGSTTYGIFNSNSDVRVEGSSGAIPGASLYGYAWSGNTINVIGNNALVDATGLSASCKASVDSSFTSGRRLDRLCSYAAYAKSGVSLASSTQISGGDLGSGATISVSDTVRVSGNVLAGGAITKGASSVYGQSMRSRSTISGTAAVYGTQTAGATAAQVPTPTWPQLNYACSSGKPPGGVDQVLSANATLAPGTYGNVSYNTGSRILTLQAGDYYLGNLDLSQSNLTVTLPTASNATVRIFACGRVTFGSGLNLVNALAGSSLRRFQIYSLSTANSDWSPAIFLNSGSARPLLGTFVAPAGKIVLGWGTPVQGSVWANEILTSSNATLSADGFAGASCEATGIDANPTCPITIATTPPSESAACDLNSMGYQDPTCSGYDLAADIPCGSTVPVCNHGTAIFSGDLTLGYFAAAKGQMSQAYPSKSPDGLCSAAAVSIAPGNCIDVPCSLPAGTYTVAIDPNEVLAECGSGLSNRRLDNWTVADGRSCSSGGGPVEVEYEYVARCDEDMHPLWGFLTWETTTPGTSQVAFSAKTAKTSAGLSSQSYAPLGTAEASPVDTSSCQLGGPSAGGCPVKISDVLDLGNNQGAHLALKIELLSGADSPILENWQVTYSCVFDQ